MEYAVNTGRYSSPSCVCQYHQPCSHCVPPTDCTSVVAPNDPDQTTSDISHYESVRFFRFRVAVMCSCSLCHKSSPNDRLLLGCVPPLGLEKSPGLAVLSLKRILWTKSLSYMHSTYNVSGVINGPQDIRTSALKAHIYLNYITN
jgi:hypothetical protein